MHGRLDVAGGRGVFVFYLLAAQLRGVELLHDVLDHVVAQLMVVVPLGVPAAVEVTLVFEVLLVQLMSRESL